jgi:succinate dehydrogenase / fumarate reductase, membrane anchor subunit
MTTRRIVVGAHYGLRDWLAQRVSAVVLLAYTLLLLGAVLFTRDLDYGSWAGMFSTVWMKVATLLAVLALSWHAWVGVRDIYMDYIKPTGVRLVLQVATVVALVGYAIWAVIILWRV